MEAWPQVMCGVDAVELASQPATARPPNPPLVVGVPAGAMLRGFRCLTFTPGTAWVRFPLGTRGGKIKNDD